MNTLLLTSNSITDTFTQHIINQCTSLYSLKFGKTQAKTQKTIYFFTFKL